MLFPLQTLMLNRTLFLKSMSNCTVTPAMTKAKVLTVGGQVRPLGAIHIYQHSKLACKDVYDGAIYPPGDH